MDAFIYQAALQCTECAEKTKKGIVHAHRHTLSEDNMLKDDSDMWPQGPYSEGGGEADSPQHCDMCGEFLDNPLTPDGEKMVRETFDAFVQEGRGNLTVLGLWKDAYKWVWDAYMEDEDEDNRTDLAQRRYAALEAA